MENGKHKVLNFQMSNLDTKVIIEKLEELMTKQGSEKIDILEQCTNNARRKSGGLTDY